MTPRGDLAHGRFVGPAKLLERAEALGADLPPFIGSGTSVLEPLERWGVLVPLARYVEPPSIRIRRHAEDHPRHVDPELTQEGDTPRVHALVQMQRRLDRWGHRGVEIGPLHPYDDPPPAAEEFLVNAVANPPTASTYLPIRIGRFPGGGELLDNDHSVPIYREWQALHLLELSIGGLRLMHAPGRAAAEVVAASVHGRTGPEPPEVLVWIRRQQVAGFIGHRKSLEAANWFVAYTQRALNFADGEAETDGYWLIAGDAYEKLAAEERAIASDALGRHGVSETELAAMIGWAAEQALRHRADGRPRAEGAYRLLVGSAVRMLEALGRAFEQIASDAGGPSDVVNRLFPDWLADLRAYAERTLAARTLPDIAASVGTLFATPTRDDAVAFLDWLAEGEHIQVFWHFEALRSLQGRSDRVALAALGREVIGMSAALEHIANGLGARGNALHQKLGNLFAGAGKVSELMNRAGLVKGGAGTSEADYRAREACLRSVFVSPGEQLVCRDLLVALLLRNHAQHRALAFMRRSELVEAFLCLLKAAFLTWHVAAGRGGSHR